MEKQLILHYPVPLHLQTVFGPLLKKGIPLPETEKSAFEILSLPLFPEIRESDQVRVSDALRAAL